jgi:4-amino-4-deoxy-L-arabinose transferase-like glycosyltransferase
MRSAIVARALYYQLLPNPDPLRRQIALQTYASLETFEPPTLEALVALTYRLTGQEHLWYGRIYSALFWLLGGLFVWDLARRMGSPLSGFAAAVVYLFLPFAATVSRSFQPDSLMVMGILISLWGLYRWGEAKTWPWAVFAGLSISLTVLLKGTAIYPLAPAAALFVLAELGPMKTFQNRQVWVIAGLAVSLPVLYYVFSIGAATSGHLGYWTTNFQGDWFSPRFYVLWLKFLDTLFNLPALGLSLVGILALPRLSQRGLLLGCWIGYFLFGFTFPFQIRTHEYYSLMLVVPFALGLAPLAQPLAQLVGRQTRLWRFFAVGLVFLALAYPAWISYSGAKGLDNYGDAAGFARIGDAIPQGSKVVGLTHDYGFPVMYYGWRVIRYWPASIDFAMSEARNPGSGSLADFETFFAEKTAGMDLFLVTLFGDLDAQPLLKDRLTQNYPIFAEGDGYILFDLKHPFMEK